MMTQVINDIKCRLADIYQAEEADSVVRTLLAHYLNMSLWNVYLSPPKPDAERLNALWQAVDKLAQHCPLQYVVGETEFYGLKFRLTPDVLIPRPETEELTDWIVQDVRKVSANPSLRILDIGTGSGCIAVSLASALPFSTVWAMDISQSALTVASQNAVLNRVQVNFLHADILSDKDCPASGEKFDIIVSNPPYVTQQDKAAMQPNVLDYEPHQALFPEGDNPLIFYERIAFLGKKHLNPHGCLYFEINESFSEETEMILKGQDYHHIITRKDIRGKWRMTKGCF